MSQISEQEIVDTIVGSFRLEGLEIDPQVLADMERINQGELTTEQAIQDAFDRIRCEKV